MFHLSCLWDFQQAGLVFHPIPKIANVRVLPSVHGSVLGQFDYIAFR